MSLATVTIAAIALAYPRVPLQQSEPASHDWTQWRGPQRDGVATVPGPTEWPEQLRRHWHVPVGLGHSTPLVAGERVFVFAREGEDEVVRALRLSNGQTLWRAAFRAPYRVNPAAAGHGPGPKSTPALWQDKLITLGIGGILSCLDATSGDLLWQHSFTDRFARTSPIYGVATSPLVLGGTVYVHLGGHHDGAMMALDVATGAELWSTVGDGPGYASPIVIEQDGQRQLVTQTDSHIVGVAPASGLIVWKIPFTTDYDQNSVTALVHGERLIVSGLDRGAFALQLSASAGALKSTEVWRNDATPMYMSSPVLSAGRLFGFSHKRSGQFFALDPQSGATLWTSNGREGENAALLVVGNRVLALTDGAELLVLDPAANEFAPLHRYTVADTPTWAHPVVTGHGVLIKALDTLALWGY